MNASTLLFMLDRINLKMLVCPLCRVELPLTKGHHPDCNFGKALSDAQRISGE